MPLNTEHVDSVQAMSHDNKPVVAAEIAVGAGGLTDSLVKQLQRELAHQHYVRIRIPFGNRERRQNILDQLLALSGAELVQRCGYEALLHSPAVRQAKTTTAVQSSSLNVLHAGDLI